MRPGRKYWLKNALVSFANLIILGFLFFVGSITIHEPAGLRGQTGLIIPNDALVYQGKVTSLNVVKEQDSVTFEAVGKLTTYLLLNDQEIITGSDVQLEIPALNLQNNLMETASGAYSLDLSENLTLTSQTPGIGIAEINEWQIQPLNYSFTIGDRIKNQKPNIEISPIKLSILDTGLSTRVQDMISQLPVTGYVANADLFSATNSIQEYIVPFIINFQARLFDAAGVPLSNQTLSVRLDIAGHNYSETITVATDSEGIFSYSRQESAIIRVNGGTRSTLASPLNIEGTSFIIAQVWWAPEESAEGQPNYNNQEESGPVQENEVAEDPINVATGNVYTSNQDLFIPSRGLAFQFKRFYNSQVNYEGPLGFGWTHSYNIYLQKLVNGNVRQRDGQGRLLTFTRNADGTYASPAGEYSKLTMNPDGTYVLRRKHGEILGFNAQGKLTAISDRNGNTTQLLYTAGNLTTIIDTAGRQVLLSYDSLGRIVSLTDPMGRVTRYGYDSNNDLVSVIDPLGRETTYEYNAHHCLKTITDPQRQNIEGDPIQSHRFFVYDTRGRAKEFRYDENAHKITLEYESGRTITTDSRGNKTTYYYEDISGHRLVTRIVNSQGHSKEFAWDGNLNKIRSIDENGHMTTMTYDARGNLLTMADPIGAITRFTYDSVYNMATSITDPSGQQMSYSYDAQGNLIETIDALGNATHYSYDGQGNLLSAMDTLGNATTYGYDLYGNLARVVDPLLNETRFTYDPAGNVTAMTDARGNMTRFAYDARNQLTEITYPDGTKTAYVYDEAGNRIRMTDQKNNVTDYGYDGLNRIVTVRDALGGLTRYTHDTEGNRIRTTDANRNQTTYNYDSLNRLTEVINPLGHTKRYAYDPAGNRVQLTDANGSTMRYAYDADNRLTKITYPDSTSVTFTYDAAGNRTSMTDSLGTTTYTYDALNRLIKVDGVETNDIIAYGYDANGNRVSMTDQDGGVTTYTYDDLNRLVKIINPAGEATAYSYDNQSNLTAMVYPNRTRTDYAFDPLNRLITLINEKTPEEKRPAGARDHTEDPEKKISSYTYSHDAAGLRTKVVLKDGDTVEYAYDALNRLVSEIRRKDGLPGKKQYAYTYTYDKAGNRVSMIRFIRESFLGDMAGDNNDEDPQGRGSWDEDLWLMPGITYFHYNYDADNRLRGIEIRHQPQEAKKDAEEKQKLGEEHEHERGAILVKFKAGTTPQEIERLHAKYQCRHLKKIPGIDVYKIEIPAGTTAGAAAAQYGLEAAVQYAEPDYMMRALAFPNDPDLTKQWGLHNAGQTGGRPDADIDAPEAWEMTTGSVSTVVAVVDTGADLDHPDLQGKFIAGHDFVNDDSDPQDDNGHGSYVAGILGAVANNTAGGAGVLWQNQIMPLKALGSDGRGTVEEVASAIVYAADNGADVINLSLGGEAPSNTLLEAMAHAYAGGAVLAAAAGNDNGPVVYPAKYTQFCIAVAATDHNDQRAAFSNLGAEIDAAAPGVNIYSAWLDGTYTTASGTSAAAPFVAGVAGLVLSREPALPPGEVESRIKSAAEDVNAAVHPGHDVYVGAGRVNARQALIEPLAAPAPVLATITYDYDANGNQIRETIHRNGLETMTAYQYDYENRLVKITYPNQITSEYRYDAGGRRIESVEANRITKFLYDGLNVIIERDWQNTTRARYTRGLGYGGGIGGIISEARLRQDDDGEETRMVSRYYHYDGLGTVTGLSDAKGHLKQSFVYDAFGNMLRAREESEGATAGRYRFSTKELSAQSGLVYFGARYYDPKIGRFITPDPLTWGPDDPRRLTATGQSGFASKMILEVGSHNPDFLHRYFYTKNNPVNFIDRWGFSSSNIGSLPWEYISAIASAIFAGIERLAQAPLYLKTISEVGSAASGLLAITGTGIELYTIYTQDTATSKKILQSVIVVGANVGAFAVSAFLITPLAATGPGVAATIVVDFGVGVVFGLIKDYLLNNLN